MTTKAVERARHNLLSALPRRAHGHLTQVEQQGWLSLQPRAPGRVNSLPGIRTEGTYARICPILLVMLCHPSRAQSLAAHCHESRQC